MTDWDAIVEEAFPSEERIAVSTRSPNGHSKANTVRLTPEAYALLRQLAADERRTLGAQASLLIEQATKAIEA